MNNLYFSSRASAAALMLTLLIGAGIPSGALAATSRSSADAEATIDSSSLQVDTNKRISIVGTAIDTDRVRFTITNEDTDKVVFKSKVLKVRDEEWAGAVTKSKSKKMKDGSYTVTVYNAERGSKEELAEGTLTIGKSTAVLKVAPIALLSGGTATRGSLVPISYLQVMNQGESSVAIKGFWVRQNGSAPDAAVTAFTSVDDRGGSRATSTASLPLKKGVGYVPSAAVIAPGSMKLFTLKAQVAGNAVAGNTLMLDVTGIDADARFSTNFPVRGTTWTVGL